MTNLIKKITCCLVAVVLVLVMGGYNFVFADSSDNQDQKIKHYYDFTIDENGSWTSMNILGDKLVNILGTIEEERNYDPDYHNAEIYGTLVYGTGYEIIPPVIYYRAGGKTVGEVEYFDGGAIGIVRIDYAKRKKDRLEVYTDMVEAIDSGQDDQCGSFSLNDAGSGKLEVAVSHGVEMTNHKGLRKSDVYNNKTTFDKICQCKVWFDGDCYDLKHNETRIKFTKVNWYDLSQERSLFDDVADDFWGRVSINKCKNIGVIDGVGNNNYSPNAVLTKAEVIQVLYKLYQDQPKQQVLDLKINDVLDNQWYSKPIKWGVNNKIVDLNNGNFNPNSPASREWTCKAFYEAAYKKGVGLPNWKNKTVENIVYDMIDRDPDSQKALIALYNAEIISGYPDGLFHPDDNLTRSQLAVLLDNFCYAKKQIEEGIYMAETY